MKRNVLLACIAFTLFQTGIAQNKNMTLLGTKTYQQNLSDVWGYADGIGREYALVGVYNGVSIVNVSNPTNPVELFFIPGVSSTWRDLKVWNKFAYVSNENAAGQGLVIIDMTYLPDSIKTYTWSGNNGVTFNRAHNIFIDENGYLYIIGADFGAGGAIIADVFTNPKSPNVKTVYNHAYIHDVFVRGDTMWAAEINNGWFSVVDVSNKTGPALPASSIKATFGTPSTFTHNVWLSDDGDYLFTTDEVSGGYIGGYDVSDLSNIKEVDRYRSNSGSGVIPHNTFYINGFLVTSYYRDGVNIVDASYPNTMVEMGNYDTSPLAGNGFNGCWGVYPYLPSGNILASDIENGLFVLGPNYQKACYLEGTVTDTLTGLPIFGVDVFIQSFPDANTETDLLGKYNTGLADSGLYTVTFSKVGFTSKSFTVNLDNGVITTLNAQLYPLIPFNLTGWVRDQSSGKGIAGAHVLLEGVNGNYKAICDTSGSFLIPSMFADQFNVYAGQWGWVTDKISNTQINQGSGPLTVYLDKGYYDDFIFDFVWTVSGNATSGDWERAEPVGTTYGNTVANPEFDLPNDFGDKCYTTGNGGGSAGSDDVDNGRTILRSPTFDLSQVNTPYISYYRWFFNDGGAGSPNDSMIVRLSNGITTLVTDVIVNGDPFESQWRKKYIDVKNIILPTANMHISFDVGDIPPNGHLVEGGLDLFRAFDSITPPVAGIEIVNQWGCTPFTITLNDISTNYPTAWEWTLPGSDIGFSTLKNPVATYANDGSFPVILKVSNAAGSDSIYLSSAITVFPVPTLALTATPDSGALGIGTATVIASGGLPPYQYIWSDPLQQQSATASGLSAGSYHVIVTDSLGCSDTGFVVIAYPTGTSTIKKEIVLSAFPNPFSSEITIHFNFAKVAIDNPKLEVYNILGEIIQSKFLNSSFGSIELSGFKEPGIYFVKISDLNSPLGTLRIISVK